MAHFAEIDNNNKVTQVVVVNNSDLIDESGNESEQKGIIFLQGFKGENTKWVQTSYTAKIRKHFAGIDYTWDKERNAFIPPKPTEGDYCLNEETCNWEFINN